MIWLLQNHCVSQFYWEAEHEGEKKSNCDVRNLEYESLKQKSGFRFKIVNFMFSYDFVFTILLSSQLKINNENANQISYDILHVWLYFSWIKFDINKM